MNSRKLKTYLDKASWEACNAVLNSLARLNNSRNSSEIFQYQEIQPGGSKPRSIKISTAKKKEVLTIDANGKNSWSQTWVKSLNKKEQSSAVNALLHPNRRHHAEGSYRDDLVEPVGQGSGRQSQGSEEEHIIGKVSLMDSRTKTSIKHGHRFSSGSMETEQQYRMKRKTSIKVTFQCILSRLSNASLGMH